MLSKKRLHFNSHMGRMGNQMFQYACAKGMKWRHGFETSLSDLDKMPYFELEKGERLRNRISSFLFFRLWKVLWGMDELSTRFSCMQQSFYYELLSLRKPTQVWGFFQSPEYFKGVEDRIRKAFRVKKKYYSGFQRFLEEHQLKEGNYLAIHLRRTDYKGFNVPGLEGDDFTLPESYYHKAIQLAQWHGKVVFVSDEPDAINQLFPGIDNKIISRGDAISDFLILRHAGACILSNSTFAWWAAWLNEDIGLVICPKYFLGFKEHREVPVGIYPDQWKQLEVYEN